MQAERIAPRVEQQKYRGSAIDVTYSRTSPGARVRFSHKDLEVIGVYETHLIAEALDGGQFQIGIEEWNRSAERDGDGSCDHDTESGRDCPDCNTELRRDWTCPGCGAAWDELAEDDEDAEDGDDS